MEEAPPVALLLERSRQGDAEAARRLFERYAVRLSRLAEQHLSRKLLARVDGEDVVQSVFRTFFRRSAAGEFHIDSSLQLWRLLVKITLCKARSQGRLHTAAARDVAAEQAPDDDGWLPDAVAREPGPEEAVALVDQIEVLLRGLPPLHARVLECRLEGHAVTDVAAQLGVCRQTVHRVLNQFQERLSASLAPPVE